MKENNLSISQFRDKRSVFDLDPELLALFPHSLGKRGSDFSTDAIRSSQFKSLQKYKGKIMRQATVASPAK